MIDFHTHILPSIDDGSKNVSQSLDMLMELKNQGVKTVVATPHFYIQDNDVDVFLKKMDISSNALCDAVSKLTEPMPKVVLGAEVYFCIGMHKLIGIEKLCISGTNYILIEMPFKKWNKRLYNDLGSLISECRLRPIIAHIERYTSFQDDKNIYDRLIDMGAIIQINSSFINDFWTRRKALRLLKFDKAHLIGSDCHNMENRCPTIGSAFKQIEKSLRNDKIRKINEFSENVLKDANYIF